MVIVKQASEEAYMANLTGFTFQYGYSKTYLFLHSNTLVILFTFQYGYSKTVVNKRNTDVIL